MTQPSADALSMSLDDIIVKQKAAKKSSRGGNRPKPSRAAPYSTGGANTSSLASAADKLVVSNLAQSVSQSDVRELFSRIGPLKTAQLNFNEKGVSKGVATVLFQRAGDAHKAFQEYNNRPLDNKPMKIELIINPESSKIKQLDSRLGGGVSKHQGSSRRGGRGGSRSESRSERAPRAPRGPRVPKKDVTAMDLDADMDAYMAADATTTASLADQLA